MGELSRECDIPVKIIPLGDVGVGKTMLVRTLTGASFNAGRYGCSIGCDFRICNIEGCRLQLWDIPGMERFGYSRMFLRNAKVSRGPGEEFQRLMWVFASGRRHGDI